MVGEVRKITYLYSLRTCTQAACISDRSLQSDFYSTKGKKTWIMSVPHTKSLELPAELVPVVWPSMLVDCVGPSQKRAKKERVRVEQRGRRNGRGAVPAGPETIDKRTGYRQLFSLTCDPFFYSYFPITKVGISRKEKRKYSGEWNDDVHSPNKRVGESRLSTLSS